MKTKSLLALLVAAAMLCTAALPAYADDDTPPAAPAVEEQVPETLPTAGQQTGGGDIEQQNHVTTLEAPQNGEGASVPVVQNIYGVSIGGSDFSVQNGEHLYLLVQNGTVQMGSQANHNVEAVGEENCVHVTLNGVSFADTGVQGYSTISSNQNLHVTLHGENTGYGTVFSWDSLTIDGDGSLSVTIMRNTNWHAGFAGKTGLAIEGNVKLHFNNQDASASASGLHSESSVKIGGNANITLEGNLESGIYAPHVPVQMDGGTVEINGAKTGDGGGILAGTFSMNAGRLTIKNTRGNGIYTDNDTVLNGGVVTISNTDHFKPDDSRGKGISAGSGKVVIQNGATLICDDAECNDVFGANGIVVDGATLNLTNGEQGLVVYQGDITVKNSNVTVENHRGNGLSIYKGNIKIEGTDGEVKISKTGAEGIHTENGNIELNGNVSVIDAGRVPTNFPGEYDAIATGTQGNVTVTGGKVRIVNASGNGMEGGASNNGVGNVSIENGEVKIESYGSALAAVNGTVSISGASKVEGTSGASGIFSMNGIKVAGNDCEITLTGEAKAVSRAVEFENADELVKLGGADAASAQEVAPDAMPDCKYLHIYKGKARPTQSVTISTKNWTEGGSTSLPTATDENGNVLKAKVYYKVKGADDATYTEIVPTAAGDYDTKLVVLADGEYSTAVYYGVFSIMAKTAQPATPSNSGSTTTVTATATAQSTAAPRVAAKPQSAPAAVTAAIPQTSDAFPYAGLAALMGTAALGMAGVTVLRKKRQ